MSALLGDFVSKNLKTYLLVATVLCSLLLLTACPENRRNESQQKKRNQRQPVFMEALSDFVFVGSGVSEHLKAPPHKMEAVSLPLEYQTGYQYVFHYRRSAESGNIYKTLRARLQWKGIKITSPDATGDRYLGGPSFRISFEGDGFKGVIYNNLDGQIINSEPLSKEWTEDDYILVLEQV